MLQQKKATTPCKKGGFLLLLYPENSLKRRGIIETLKEIIRLYFDPILRIKDWVRKTRKDIEKCAPYSYLKIPHPFNEKKATKKPSFFKKLYHTFFKV